jgi:hypothetical protein
MQTRKTGLFLAVFLAMGAFIQAQSTEWLHVHVQDPNKEETVRINMPISIMETLLPMVQEEAIREGKFHFNDHNISKSELKKLWSAIKKEGDTDYMTIEKPGEKVVVSMQGKFFVVQTVKGSRDNVDIRIPAAVMDAMLSGPGEELDLMAAVKALRESGVKDIITVKGDDATVRVWIDNNKQAL